MAYNLLKLPLQGIQLPLLASQGTTLICTYSYICNLKIKRKSLKMRFNKKEQQFSLSNFIRYTLPSCPTLKKGKGWRKKWLSQFSTIIGVINEIHSLWTPYLSSVSDSSIQVGALYMELWKCYLHLWQKRLGWDCVTVTDGTFHRWPQYRLCISMFVFVMVSTNC